MSLLMLFMRDSPLNERTLNTGEMDCSFNMAFQPFDEFLTTALQVDMDRFAYLQLVAYNTSKALPCIGDRGCYPATRIIIRSPYDEVMPWKHTGNRSQMNLQNSRYINNNLRLII